MSATQRTSGLYFHSPLRTLDDLLFNSDDRLGTLALVGWVCRIGIRVALRLLRMPLHVGDRQFLRRCRVAPPARDMGCALATSGSPGCGQYRRRDDLLAIDAAMPSTVDCETFPSANEGGRADNLSKP
jgi:hypothetical protein